MKKRILVLFIMCMLLLVGCRDGVVDSQGSGGGGFSDAEDTQEATDDEIEDDVEEEVQPQDDIDEEANEVSIVIHKKVITVGDETISYDDSDVDTFKSSLKKQLEGAGKVKLTDADGDRKATNCVKELLEELGINYVEEVENE